MPKNIIDVMNDTFDTTGRPGDDVKIIEIPDFITGGEIEINKGADVEDDNEEHHSTGIYSVLNDEWYKKPKPTKKKIDKKAVLKKVQDIISRYKELVEEGGTESNYKKLFKKILRICDFNRINSYII